jgi:replicative DNA helicase
MTTAEQPIAVAALQFGQKLRATVMAQDPSHLPPMIRVAPHCIELEQALLGAILLNNEAFCRVSDFLEPWHFFEPLHQKLFKIASDLIRAGKVVTPITLKSFLPADIDVAGLTINQYIARLAAEATTVINAADYGGNIFDLAAKRSLVEIGEAIVNAGYEETVESDPRRIAAGAIEELDGIVTLRADARVARVEIGAAAEEAVRRMSEAMQNPGRLQGLTWGLADIDKLTSGLEPGLLYYMAGRPGMGKTGVALSSSLRAAKAGHSVLFFSLEMTGVSIATRALADLCYDAADPIEYTRIRKGEVSDAQAQRIVDAERCLKTLPFIIEQQPALTSSQLLARARKAQQSHLRKGRTLDLVVVDHIHIMQPSDRYKGTRVSELTEISASLKALAKELGLPVLALAQLLRAVEGREDKRPQLSDLRDSGSLEQDADVVIFLYREEYYLQLAAGDDAAARDKKYARLHEVRNVLQFMIAKQRNGETGIKTVFFDAACNHIDDLKGLSR